MMRRSGRSEAWYRVRFGSGRSLVRIQSPRPSNASIVPDTIRFVSAQKPIRLGVSACLLGDQVRYDGGHKRDAFLTDLLGPFVEWVKVCPEVEIGMGTPRESIRLMTEDGRIRLVTVKSGVDYTDRMEAYASRRLNELAHDDLCGYVLKKDSPSCGMTRVKVYAGSGPGRRSGTGVFARALLARFPDLPVEEEGRLQDHAIRENFVERVFAYRRLRDLF